MSKGRFTFNTIFKGQNTPADAKTLFDKKMVSYLKKFRKIFQEAIIKSRLGLYYQIAMPIQPNLNQNRPDSVINWLYYLAGFHDFFSSFWNIFSKILQI